MGEVTANQSEHAFPNPVYSWYVVGVIFVSGSFAFVDRTIISLITPALQADLGLRDSQLGLLQGLAFAIFYTLFGVPLGIVADRWSRKRLLAIGMSVWSLTTAAGGLAKGFGSLFLARLGVGMGEATLNPCVTSLISDYFPPRTRPRAMACHVMGQGFGHGLAYVFGGMLLGWLAARGGLDIPFLGRAKVWQATFILIGLAGLIPTVLFALTVREPVRREVLNKDQPRASSVQIRKFMMQNRGTLLCLYLGIALTTMTAYAFGNWMPTFFLRVHGWPPQRFSVIYGSIALVLGIALPFMAGVLTEWLKQRGVTESAWRIAMFSSIGATTFGAIAPLMPTPELSLGAYIIAGVFASPPATLAYVIISEFVPNEMRGVITGAYFLVNGVISVGLGPFAVGLATDYLFKDNAAIGNSLALVSIVTGLPAALLLAFGLKSFRNSLVRVTWILPASAANVRR